MKPLDLVLGETGKWTRVDFTDKGLNKLIRPIVWSCRVSGMCLIVFFIRWLDGNVENSALSWVLLGVLLVNLTFSLWALYTVAADFRLKRGLVSQRLIEHYREFAPDPSELPPEVSTEQGRRSIIADGIGRIAERIFLFAGALLLAVPPIMVFYLEGPSWPALQFAGIQGVLLVMCGWLVYRGRAAKPDGQTHQ